MTEQTELLPDAYTHYADFTATTARYPIDREKLYLALGLCDETADELLCAYQRGNATDMFLELGDSQWYACRLCYAFGLDFSKVVSDAKMAWGVLTPVELPAAVTELIKTAGKIAGRVKKHARDSDTWNDHTSVAFLETLRSYLVHHVAISFLVIDGLWKLDREIGNYDACLRANMAKLGGRVERGTLRGEGDYR